MNEYEMINKLLPENIKVAVANYQMHTLAPVVAGLHEFTLDKIAEHIGQMMARRHAKWRPVANGLLAYHSLITGE